MGDQNFHIADGTITSATSVVGPVDTTEYSYLVVSFFGTYAGVTANFEASQDNGATWFGIEGAATNSSSETNSAVLSTNAVISYAVNVAGFELFRVRASAWTSGTASVEIAGSDTEFGNGITVQVANSVSATPLPSTTSGGYSSTHKLLAAATTNATSVKVTAASVGTLVLANLSAAVKFFKIFNKASAPTVGTDVPVITIPIQPNQTLTVDFEMGLRLTTGLAYAITGLVADNDTTAVAAGDVLVNINYL